MKGPHVERQTEEVLAAIPRDDFEELRVTICGYRGRRYADVRVWKSTRAGIMMPSTKGIMIRPGELAEVVAALDSAMTALGVEVTPDDKVA